MTIAVHKKANPVGLTNAVILPIISNVDIITLFFFPMLLFLDLPADESGFILARGVPL